MGRGVSNVNSFGIYSITFPSYPIPYLLTFSTFFIDAAMGDISWTDNDFYVGDKYYLFNSGRLLGLE